MANEQKPPEKKDPMDGEYLGNIWGWKISYIGLAVILFFVGVIIYREMTVGEERRQEMKQEQEEVQPLVDPIETIRSDSLFEKEDE